MLVLLLPLLLCHWAYGADFHAINMLHLSYFHNESSVEVVGNATLDGKLTHTLAGHNEELNVSQLLPLEPSHLWTQRKHNLRLYMQQFQNMVKVIARERKVAYPFHVHCIQGSLIFHNSTSHSFYEVALNGSAFLKFYAANATWVPLEASPVACYATDQLNFYNETTKNLQFFLQETCVKFVMEHSDVNQPLTGEHQGRSHTPLVLGIIVGAFALLGLAVCIFLCTETDPCSSNLYPTPPVRGPSAQLQDNHHHRDLAMYYLEEGSPLLTLHALTISGQKPQNAV